MHATLQKDRKVSHVVARNLFGDPSHRLLPVQYFAAFLNMEIEWLLLLSLLYSDIVSDGDACSYLLRSAAFRDSLLLPCRRLLCMQEGLKIYRSTAHDIAVKEMLKITSSSCRTE